MSNGSYAELSCTSCRRLKRKCSKEVPTCSLCRRVGRECEYPTPLSSPELQSQANGDHTATWIPLGSDSPQGNHEGGSAAYTSDLPLSIGNLNRRGQTTKSKSVFAAAWFIDSVAARGMDVRIPVTLRWDDIDGVRFPVSNEEARNICARHFKTIHTWLPVGRATSIDLERGFELRI